jgi:tetratricopeptide (TPR) repeat protein
MDLNRADKINPDNHVTLRARGNVKRKLGNYKDALRDLNRANDLSPDSSWILGVRGDVKRKLGDLHGALADLNSADELEPNNNFTLRVRGKVKKLLGDEEGALNDLTLTELLENGTNIDDLDIKTPRRRTSRRQHETLSQQDQRCTRTLIRDEFETDTSAECEIHSAVSSVVIADIFRS